MAVWEGINEFVAVTETGSFTAAASRLGTSVANVSRQVSALEQRLGVKLLNRTTRKVSVTADGATYYQRCRQILDNLEDAQRSVSNLQREPIGKLRLTAPVAYGERYIAPLVNSFCQQHPGLEVELQLSNRQLDLVEEGFDLGIRLGTLQDSRLVAKKLGSRRLHVCASPDYLQRHGQPHTLSELTGHNCLLGTLDYWRFVEAGKLRSIHVKGNLRCNSGPVLLDAALKGMGLVQLPDYYVAGRIACGDLIEVLASYAQEEEGIWALYPQNRHLSAKVRMLIDFLNMNLRS